MRLALYQPDIPQNAGTMLRLCACLSVTAAVIEPAGFDVSDKALRRAGLDYLAAANIVRYASFAEFERQRRESGARLVLLTSRGATPYTEFAFAGDDVLMVGRESAGVPEAVHAAADARVFIPMQAGLRSLNVAVSAAMVLGEAIRQTGAFARLQASRSEVTE
jgi:tRNA (cytidine/uridine-2'-O-)-methyltransferase